MPHDWLISALQQQVECYRRLAKLAGVQHEHVQRNDAEGLLEVLARRQEELDRIEALDKTVAPLTRGWPRNAGELDPQTRATAQQLLGETRLLLEQITAADLNDTMVLQQRKLSVSQEIRHTAAARQVNRRYAAAAYAPPQSSMDLHR
jgi:hypothetical protein